MTEQQLSEIESAAKRGDCITPNAVLEMVAEIRKSTHHTICAVCGKEKETPLRNDKMGGYVCLSCIEKELIRLQSESDIHMEIGNRIQ